MNIAISVNNHKIRLTNERWEHIMSEHPEMKEFYHRILETITLPLYVYSGSINELMAIGHLDNSKYIVVVYKETELSDGFVITAFITSRMNYFTKKEIVWKKM